MKKKRCYICNREVVPVIQIRAISYEKKKCLLSSNFKLVSKPFKIFICGKCIEVGKALIANNIAVKTSDIMDE